MAYTFCQKCDMELNPGDKFCGKCGSKAAVEGVTPEPIYSTSLMVAVCAPSTPNQHKTAEPRKSTPFLDDLEAEFGLAELSSAIPPQLPDEVDVPLDDIAEPEVLELPAEDLIMLSTGEMPRPDLEPLTLVFGPPRRKTKP